MLSLEFDTSSQLAGHLAMALVDCSSVLKLEEFLPAKVDEQGSFA